MPDVLQPSEKAFFWSLYAFDNDFHLTRVVEFVNGVRQLRRQHPATAFFNRL